MTLPPTIAALRLCEVRGARGLAKRIRTEYSDFGAFLAAAMTGDDDLARARRALATVRAGEDDTVAAWRRHGDVVSIFAASYPERLLRLADPPLFLFVSGAPLPQPPLPAVAIVGTRTPSTYGRAFARRLAADLAGAGIVVGSGLADGIDSAAHRGALDGGGRTWACLGASLAAPLGRYPGGRDELRRDVLAGAGTVFSEVPPGQHAERWRFAARNRLMAALADVVVVIEGHAKSGALITAECALDLGTEVMALPGRVGEPMAEAPLKLLKAGAAPVLSAQCVLDALGSGARGAARPAAPALPVALRALFAALPEAGAKHVDELAATLRAPTPQLLAQLLELELHGAVRALPGKFYTRNSGGPH